MTSERHIDVPHGPNTAGKPGEPAVGTLLLDTAHDKVGEFRGECEGSWFLRPVGGGVEWETDPADTRPARPADRARARSLAEERVRGKFRL
ncbi:hypothetical protein [Streptomyces sp. NPDC047097]|uniref:hypothetical protein n=1 Tax=Streptomyces sp. NPDC047097 TaxID=3155260 RepID=UPI0033FAE2FE